MENLNSADRKYFPWPNLKHLNIIHEDILI